MITADSSMYHSKRAGKNRVTGVPVMDEAAIGRSGPVPEAPAAAPTEPPLERAAKVPAAVRRGPADKSV
jgi:hypothetical protein